MKCNFYMQNNTNTCFTNIFFPIRENLRCSNPPVFNNSVFSVVHGGVNNRRKRIVGLSSLFITGFSCCVVSIRSTGGVFARFHIGSFRVVLFRTFRFFRWFVFRFLLRGFKLFIWYGSFCFLWVVGFFRQRNLFLHRFFWSHISLIIFLRAFLCDT